MFNAAEASDTSKKHQAALKSDGTTCVKNSKKTNILQSVRESLAYLASVPNLAPQGEPLSQFFHVLWLCTFLGLEWAASFLQEPRDGPITHLSHMLATYFKEFFIQVFAGFINKHVGSQLPAFC